MKITKKFVLALTASLFLASAVFAQEEFGGFGDFSDDSGFGDMDSGSETTFTLSGNAEVTGRYFPRRDNSEFNTHNYDMDFSDLKNKATRADASFALGVDYSGAFSDFSGKLKFNPTILNDYREDILQEFTARAYLGNFQIEAGKMKLVWGKGDKVHVLDNFNSNDYTDFIVPDYIDRRLALPMFHLVYNAPFNARFEGVFTPWMTPDRLASSGMWKPAASASLESQIETLVKAPIYEAIAANDGNANKAAIDSLMAASSFKADSLYPDTKRLKYSQGGLRATFTIGSVDLGASYYYGHYKQPSANLEKLIAYTGLKTNQVQNAAVTSYINGVAAKVREMLPAIKNDPAKATAAAALITAVENAQTNEDIYKIIYANQGAISAVTGSPLTVYTEDQVRNAVVASAASNGYTTSSMASLPSLNYDQLQVFGLEAATVIGPFNTRAEVAYNLTKDIAGDDPWVKNNSIAWEAGFDINLPIHNVNVNFQTTGKYILKNDKIENGSFKLGELEGTPINIPTKEYDTDYDKTGKYHRNQLILDVTDTFNHEKIKLDVKGIYQIETKDLMVLPSLSFRLGGDDFTLNLSGLVIWCYDEDSEYYAWRNNDFASVGIKYQF